MNIFERYLTLWVFICIVVGIAIGKLLPSLSQTVGSMEYAQVNLPSVILVTATILVLFLLTRGKVESWF